MLTLNFTFCPLNPDLCIALKNCKIILMSHFMTCSIFHFYTNVIFCYNDVLETQ